MCGRFSLSVTPEELLKHLRKTYDITELDIELNVPKYNIAPSQLVLCILNDGTSNRVGYIPWGMVPSFSASEEIGLKIVNAKAETLREKVSFSESLQKRRIVILADGFYEWKRVGNKRIPTRVTMKNSAIFPMAGIYSPYVRKDGSIYYSCAVITTEANDLMKEIHDRMPAILTDRSLKEWLDPTHIDSTYLTSLLQPYDSKLMKSFQVSNVVNAAINDVAECLIPVK